MLLSDTAETILKERYYDRSPDGDIIEDWEGLSHRVANHIAGVEPVAREYYEQEFFEMIFGLDFVPNTPCLMNAGSRGGLNLFSACFVQVPDDSIDSIMQHAWHSAKLFQAGAGVGYNFSHLRGEGEMVKSSMRPSSGSISFMKHIFNSIGDVVKQGGRRRAAMMGLLNDSHPEIEKFIQFKNKEDSLENFNISIFTSDAFMQAVINKKDWPLREVSTGRIIKWVSARDLFDKMIANNKAMAEPGMIWGDTINRHNPLLDAGYRIECVNPCGEATLLNYENCCLGSVNLMKHLSNNDIDWVKFEKTIRMSVRFLDDVVSANQHVAPEFRDASLSTRRIGLGVTGFADALVKMGSIYGSSSSFGIAHNVASFLNRISTDESTKLAEEKGPYPLWEKSQHKAMGLKLRNVSLLAIAPEGSRSLITSTSPSIEPNFGREIIRSNKGIGAGTWVHPLAYKEDESGYLIQNPNFVTTYEVTLKEHVKMQSVWQNAMNTNMVAQSISKTNNAASNITEPQLADAYIDAWEMGCKGLTTYVDGSRDAVYYEKKEGEIRDENGKVIQECSTGSCDVGFAKVHS